MDRSVLHRFPVIYRPLKHHTLRHLPEKLVHNKNLSKQQNTGNKVNIDFKQKIRLTK